jgi:hypothetical protein
MTPIKQIKPPHEVKQQPTSLFQELFTENPVFDEGKRGVRHFLRTANSLGKFGPYLVGIILGFLYFWLIRTICMEHTDGTVVFVILEAAIIMIVLVGSIYAAISGEIEKSTWNALILTRLTPGQIVVGKFLWRLRVALLIAVLCLIPTLLSRICASRCDAPFSALVASQFLILGWSFFVCSLTFWLSSISKKSLSTLGVSTAVLLSMLVLIPVLWATFAAILMPGWSAEHDELFSLTLAFNPAISLVSVLQPGNGQSTIQYVQFVEQSGYDQFWVYTTLSGLFLWLTYSRLRLIEMPQKS